MLYTIVDIETTGNGIKGNKITEIAIFKFDGEKVVDEFTSLVNPQCSIPYFITGLTGIDDQMVLQAPIFEEIAEKVLAITKDSIFVAHAVNFDYGVIKEEFRQIGIDFIRKKLCTVRLSRKLIPGLQSYSLGKLCSAIQIPLKNRHRARGDAHATTLLFKRLLDIPESSTTIASFLNARSQEATLPPLLSKTIVNALPDKPGVYYFKNKVGKIIYVGKAINIKKRVLGHFYDKSVKETRMCREIAAIDFELAGSELLALLMESAAIKKHFPVYNSAQKRVSKVYAVFTYEDRSGYLHLAYGLGKNVHNPLKTFHNQGDCKIFLQELCNTYELCPKYCTLRKVRCEMISEQCKGACQNKEHPTEYNQRVRQALGANKTKTTIYIKEKGRDNNEEAVISVINGRYQGYAFISKETVINTVEDIDVFMVKQKSTAETDSIVAGYMLRNNATKILEFDSCQFSERE